MGTSILPYYLHAGLVGISMDVCCHGNTEIFVRLIDMYIATHSSIGIQHKGALQFDLQTMAVYLLTLTSIPRSFES